MGEKFESDWHDTLTYYLTVNIYSLNKNRSTIDIYGYDSSNKAHKWYLDAAIKTANIFSRPLRMHNKFLTRFAIWCRHHKSLKWIKYVKKEQSDVYIDETLEFMRDLGKTLSGNPNFDFSEMYDYYESIGKENGN